ncbi:MAG: hypothetical protein ING75_03700 [Rhodocyclaceae bacterium]|nr:hypothetical protein [Rhodocyclaceae bacterium]
MISAPTDSLYKFLAIAGVVMVLWGAAFPWNKAYEARLEGAVLRADIRVVGEKAVQLKGQNDELSRQLEAANDESLKQALRAKKRDLYIQLIEAQHPVNIGLEKVKVVDEANQMYMRIGWISVTGGAALTLIGFVAWYFRIQQYVDRDVKAGRKPDSSGQSEREDQERTPASRVAGESSATPTPNSGSRGPNVDAN